MYTQCARVPTEGWTLGHNYLLKDVTGALGWVLKGKESPTSSRDGSKLHQFVFLELFLTPDECPGILIRKSQGHRVREASGFLRRSPGQDLCPVPGVFSLGSSCHCLQAVQRGEGP